MSTNQEGSLNHNWRGGRLVASNGYVLLRVGVGHPLADVRGYAYEHRVVAERKIGRPLVPGEQVHHIDENKQNNAPENLEVLTVQEHKVEHRKRTDLRLPGEPNPTIPCGCNCGEFLLRYDPANRPRKFISGHNPTKKSKYRDVLLHALRSGPQTREALAKASGADPNVVHRTLRGMESDGEVVLMSHGTWAASPTATDLPLELARAVADHLLNAGFLVDAANAGMVAAALRETADAYEEWARPPSSSEGQ